MSSQIRYRTLVRNIGRIYAAPKDSRMDLLQTGLDEIVAIVGPHSSDSWFTVGADSERLLKVWVAKETGDPAAITVAQQLTDILMELADGNGAASEPPSPPKLVIKESPAAPMNTPATITMSRPVDPITHIHPFTLASTTIPVIDVSPVSSVPEVKEVVIAQSPIVIDADVDGDVDGVEVVESDDDDAASGQLDADADDEEGEVVDDDTTGDDDDDEVLEPADEDDEEEGMSVEQITIRGRTYWRDTDTDDLYAVVGDDDVGDKVGQLVNGVARFLPVAGVKK